MSENTAPAKCSEAVYQAARAAGVLIVTTGEEAAIQAFADAIQVAAYAEGRKDEREQWSDLVAAARLVIAWYEAEDDHSKADFYQRIEMCRESERALRAALEKVDA